MARKSHWLRPAVQGLFIIAVLIIGVRFGGFVDSISDPQATDVSFRPPGVEAFLPISSLMSLVYFLKTGIANRVHPAGFVIFTITLALALIMRRGFCSWACPIGAISEYAHKFGKWLFGRNLNMPKWLDIPLQGLKFFLLGFFLYHILKMPVEGLQAFIEGPYNRLADVKMYVFFANISRTALGIILILFVLSILFKNFWCRYLCPYGAALGIFSLFSPMAVERNTEKCIGCGKCAKKCPSMIAVNKKNRINSLECMACFSCVEACPADGALNMAVSPGKKLIPAAVYGIILVAAFISVPRIASAFNYWATDTTTQDFRSLYAMIDQIEHPRTMATSGSTEERIQAYHGMSPEMRDSMPEEMRRRIMEREIGTANPHMGLATSDISEEDWAGMVETYRVLPQETRDKMPSHVRSKLEEMIQKKGNNGTAKDTKER